MDGVLAEHRYSCAQTDVLVFRGAVALVGECGGVSTGPNGKQRRTNLVVRFKAFVRIFSASENLFERI